MVRRDKQSSIGSAMAWASRVTSIGFELAVPVFGGYWLDGKYGTAPWFALAGALVGIFLAVQSFRQLIRDLEK